MAENVFTVAAASFAIHGSSKEDSDAVGDSEPDLVDKDTSSEEDSDSGGEEEKLMDSAGSVQVSSLAKAGVEKIEWESMWDEVISGISDGRKLSPEAARRLAQLKEEAVEHAAV